MTRIKLISKVGPDGMLLLTLPPDAADQVVRVTIEPIGPKKVMTQEEWRAFVLSTAGIWQGELERPEQGELEERDPL